MNLDPSSLWVSTNPWWVFIWLTHLKRTHCTISLNIIEVIKAKSDSKLSKKRLWWFQNVNNGYHYSKDHDFYFVKYDDLRHGSCLKVKKNSVDFILRPIKSHTIWHMFDQCQFNALKHFIDAESFDERVPPVFFDLGASLYSTWATVESTTI